MPFFLGLPIRQWYRTDLPADTFHHHKVVASLFRERELQLYLRKARRNHSPRRSSASASSITLIFSPPICVRSKGTFSATLSLKERLSVFGLRSLARGLDKSGWYTRVEVRREPKFRYQPPKPQYPTERHHRPLLVGLEISQSRPLCVRI